VSDPIRMWRYYLPNVKGEGWAEIVLCSTGFFGAVSDYGNYAYCWPERYRGEPCMRRYILRVEADYVRAKIAPRGEYDGAKTAREVRKHLLSLRREKVISREDARHEWDLVEQNNDLSSREDFAFWWRDTSLDCAGEFYEESPCVQVVAFCESVLPRLKAAIKAELDAEAKAA
jgi:hypothetical protein